MIKNDLLKLFNIEAYQKSGVYFKFLNERKISYDFTEVLPDHFTVTFDQENKLAQSTLVSKDTYDYSKIFFKQNVFLSKLNSCVVDINLLRYYLAREDNESIKSSLNSFVPDYMDICKPVQYNRTGTRTGRLIVKSGPKILTLPAKYRNIIKSRFENGSIVELDFKSIEPRIFKKILKEEVEEDIYNQIQNKIDVPVDRSVIKRTVLSVLFGASSALNLNISQETWEKTQSAVLDFFDLKKMLDIANEVHLGTNTRMNYYGRPIENKGVSNNIIVNNYIQSTAADFFLIAFNSILESIEEKNCVPLFVLHDAIIFDVDESGKKALEDIANKGYNDNDLGYFPIGINYFNQQEG